MRVIRTIEDPPAIRNLPLLDFKNASEGIIAMSGDIAAFSSEQAKTLQQIGAGIKEIGRYTPESRHRYRTVRMRESDIKGFLANLDHIVSTRMGFWGPFRMNKKVSLDNQRLNVEGSRASADGVDTETGLLRDSIRDYVDILAWRKDRAGGARPVMTHTARLERHRDALPEIELPAPKRRLQLKDR